MMAAVAIRARQESMVPYNVPLRALKYTRETSQTVPTPAQRGRKRPHHSGSGTSSDKLEKCRTQAQQRRMTQKGLMEELATLLPFPREVTSQMDTKTVLRLAICYLRVKALLNNSTSLATSPVTMETAVATGDRWPMTTGMSSSCQQHTVPMWGDAAGEEERLWSQVGRYDTTVSRLGMGILQDLMIEALHGFIMMVSCDGTILYISGSVFTHTGLFQSEYTGRSMYSLIHEEDQEEVRDALTTAEAAALSSGNSSCSFFCRMKSKKKNSHLKAPGHKLVYVSGHCKAHRLETYVACTVHIVSAPSVLEIPVEGNAFITRHSLDMKIIFYDERLQDVMGYTKKDLIGQSLFSLHHHDDLTVTTKCSHSLREKGEAVTGYYRLMTNYGTYVWVQSRGTMVMDRRTGKPTQLICMHFIIEKSKGEESLKLRNLLTNDDHHNIKSSTVISMDPVPVPRQDGEYVDPLQMQSDELSSFSSSVESQRSDAPVIKLSSPVTSSQCSYSGMVSGPVSSSIPGHQQVYTPSRTPSPPYSNISMSWSTPTPSVSNYSTPAPSPYWSQETSPSYWSQETSPSSSLIPGSTVISPHSIPGSTVTSSHSILDNTQQLTSDATCLDAILQDLLGTSSECDPSLPPLSVPVPSSTTTEQSSVSSDCDCNDFENYLFSLVNDSPDSSLTCTPDRSPVASHDRSPVASCSTTLSTEPSHLGYYTDPTVTPPTLGYHRNPGHLPNTTSSSQKCYNFSITQSNTTTHTLRGLLTEPPQSLCEQLPVIIIS